jgi:hypothetical protein
VFNSCIRSIVTESIYPFMKQKVIVLFVFLLLAGLFLAPAYYLANAASQQITVYLEGVPLQFEVLPMYQQGALMIPLRSVFEEVGYDIAWEPDTKRVVLRGSRRTVVLIVDNPLYSVNGVVCRAFNAPFIEQGRTMVGLDLLEKVAGITVTHQDDLRGIIRLGFTKDEGDLPGYHDDEDEHRLNFLEVLLPRGDRVGVGESFEVIIAAPLVEGIFSYEILYTYDPDVIKIKDVKNPFYIPERDFYLKKINNNDGMVKYTQTTLGYQQEIPFRECLAVLEAVAFREGEVPFLAENLKIDLLDNTAGTMPAALEEKILSIRQVR